MKYLLVIGLLLNGCGSDSDTISDNWYEGYLELEGFEQMDRVGFVGTALFLLGTDSLKDEFNGGDPATDSSNYQATIKTEIEALRSSLEEQRRSFGIWQHPK